MDFLNIIILWGAVLFLAVLFVIILLEERRINLDFDRLKSRVFSLDRLLADLNQRFTKIEKDLGDTMEAVSILIKKQPVKGNGGSGTKLPVYYGAISVGDTIHYDVIPREGGTIELSATVTTIEQVNWFMNAVKDDIIMFYPNNLLIRRGELKPENYKSKLNVHEFRLHLKKHLESFLSNKGVAGLLTHKIYLCFLLKVDDSDNTKIELWFRIADHPKGSEIHVASQIALNA